MSKTDRPIDWMKTSQFIYLGINISAFIWILFLITHTKEISYTSLILNYALVSPVVMTLFIINRRILKTR